VSATSFEPVCYQDSVMEFDLYTSCEPVCDQVRAGSSYLNMSRWARTWSQTC